MGIQTTLTTTKITVTILGQRQTVSARLFSLWINLQLIHTWVPYLPTSSSSLSEARGRCFFQMSMVKSVELLLKMDVSEDIRAAIITAIISPRRPAKMHTQTLRCTWKHLKSVVWLLGKKNIFSPLGMSSMTSLGKAMLEHPTSAPHTRTHSSGSTQPTESETWRRSQKLFACRSGRWLFLSSRIQVCSL